MEDWRVRSKAVVTGQASAAQKPRLSPWEAALPCILEKASMIWLFPFSLASLYRLSIHCRSFALRVLD